MKKCNVKVCKSYCCYNVPFELNEAETYKDKIVNKILSTKYIGKGVVVYITNEVWKENKCPFLRKDCLCNIYENRPYICKRMGETMDMRCYLK